MRYLCRIFWVRNKLLCEPLLIKPKKCRVCGREYRPFNSLQKACSGTCALELVREVKRKEVRQDLRIRKVKLKTKADWAKETQIVFNSYIRLRDRNEPCISCNRYHIGKYDAGHYKTVGAHPELRFNTFNCHRQCVPCNRHKSGNIIGYRIGLLNKVGLEKLNWLERDHPPAKYSIDDLQRLKKIFQKKLKKLNKKCLHP